MSSAGPPPLPTIKKPKATRLQGACDHCRRRKIKCDSAKMPDGRCSNCIASNLVCPHTIPAKASSDIMIPRATRPTRCPNFYG
ncbi:hypothetical protein L218DRAFT_118935 [Marasmius fiardii PR-910]|nr:hypothetical protein L218DRAFT_118935 [Marasmius fiardii PR-910]